MTAKPNLKMRSWLFAPGDSEKKMAKAADGCADIVIFDLEDAVAPEKKAEARGLIHDFLGRYSGDRARLWVRVNPLDGPYTLEDLAAVMPAKPGGIMLPKAYTRADIEALDHYLSALEVANGIEQGSTPVIMLLTETAESMFHAGNFKGAPRLVAMTWGAEDLADALGASSNTRSDGEYDFTFEMARSLCLLGASTAGVPAIETIQSDFRDLEKLKLRAEMVRRQGYRGMLAIHPAQVDVINEAFTPSAEEIAKAREIVALFEANPGAGTIGHEGGMLDRPHLSRALQLLAQVEG
ncbi:citrate lyase subunit beta / citryl-CoA lyase [Altererythrobacter xiamenensis]|uniref:Citrate lyase subunit beta / citryl-CoA lyase n=1 Tax=Altererythrobacter xiamenensis TaxID=1316679 RepID=A0A1Y6FLL3_9SPHN|nr:CoA ester lyase [Altererythrobacter xiamenensis]SMQ74080.1 citrate lyase subunit beta / citryl-CoA lyase [Altererythrobacter xiamenensis]